MKRIFSVISISLLFAACQSGTGTASTTTDTTGLAELQAMKLQKEKDSLLSLQQPARQVVYVSQPLARRSVSNNTQATTATSESSNTASRSRVSKTAKGAIIGGVAGAAGGAIINKKNRAAGAVVGGVLGAGTGAVIGRQMDKRDGRY